jgi:hypothetical protein
MREELIGHGRTLIRANLISSTNHNATVLVRASQRLGDGRAASAYAARLCVGRERHEGAVWAVTRETHPNEVITWIELYD